MKMSDSSRHEIADLLPPTTSIVVTDHNNSLPPAEASHRAAHIIRLSALSHNYSVVESAANRQRCSVIVVVKGKLRDEEILLRFSKTHFVIFHSSADGYGHGAIRTALYLADHVGADAFAVATLEEGIALRKAFQQTPPGEAYQPENPQRKNTNPTVASLFQTQPDSQTTISPINTPSIKIGQRRRRFQRAPQIRIIVLGPPVGFPRCFDDYFFHNIEAMISGPEVAKALLEWVFNKEERKRIQVERAATETKELAMTLNGHTSRPTRAAPRPNVDRKDPTPDASVGENSDGSNAVDSTHRYHPPSATLGNVTGMELAKEVRKILKNQKLATPTISTTSTSHAPSISDSTTVGSTTSQSNTTKNVTTQVFAGIEEAAKMSRSRHKAITKETYVENGEDEGKSTPTKILPVVGSRKRLRWHALVDSGMGRLGFRTDPVTKADQGKRRDTVEVLKELVDLEDSLDTPIEFFGMCTHMAEANSKSDYTHAQIAKFKTLLKRVREAGISVPTLSTDNSAALLTTKLTHFDPKELLNQEFTDTRGYVRTGGGIFGQRPAFPEIKAISTLTASVRKELGCYFFLFLLASLRLTLFFSQVRHVAILKKGEYVGYDRAYIAPVNMRIATLAIGFADGYPRDLGNGIGKVAIRGSLFPVAGNVCMDMLMVELGPAEDKLGPGAEIVVGDTAVLWGPGEDEDGEGLVPLREIATLLNTTQSALTCGLDKERVLRQYE